MKTLRISAVITSVLAGFAVISLFLMFLALVDIGHNEQDSTLEWYVTGISMMVLGAFIASVIITLVLVYRNLLSLKQP